MRIPLTQGAYTALSVIANAQRCVNLFQERNAPDAMVPLTHYSCPGLRFLVSLPKPAAARGLYRANSGELYYCAGNTVYYVSPSWVLTSLGTIGTNSATPVSMADNGTTLVLVDGSQLGWQIDLATRVMTQITEATNAPPPASLAVYAFYGADRVDIIDGYFVLNQPGTRNYYATYNNEVVFDALYFAAKNGFSDTLSSLIVTRREIWLMGQKTSEIWFNAGAADFPFQIMPGPFVQHGNAALYSIAQVNGAVCYLTQDQAGSRIVARAEGYKADPISTKALEQELASYSTVDDAIGFCYQQDGHAFYVLTFPTADKTWCWDESTQLWHQRTWIDANGAEHRHRAACAAFAYETNVVADWETGQLYAFDMNEATDNGSPRQFRRGFPHLMNDGKRVIYPGFVLDIEAATSMDTTVDPNNAPKVWLRWSDDRGRTWSNPIAQSLGATGQYLTQPQWSRTGMARDRVFEVFGTIPGRIAINGAFLDPEPIVLQS